MSNRIILKTEKSFQRNKVDGTTLNDHTGHVHDYVIDPVSGNGWAYETTHELEIRINHKHRIERFIVQPSQSECHPNCKSMYGVSGIGYHGHKLNEIKK